MFTRTYLLGIALVVAATTGCGKAPEPHFRLNMTNVVSKQIDPEHRQAIADILGAMFGTPNDPSAPPESGLDIKKLKMAAGAVRSDETGAKVGLYRRHCVHCHGINGDGRGPTAAILNPYPRDYRPGVFKFKSTYTSAEPTHDDLMRVLWDGVPGTAMPSFALLPPDEVEALVEYVKYLSMRGQLETALESYAAEELNPGDKFDPTADPNLGKVITSDMFGPIVEAWNNAKDQVMVPQKDALPPENRTPQQVAESINAGRALFFGTKANCVKCHGPTALGDGQQDDYDNWNKATNEFFKATYAKVGDIETLTKELAKAQGDDVNNIKQQLAAAKKEYQERKDLLGSLLDPRNAIPRNLREGIYRGGRRPLDIYWRISSGIAGTPMPASGPASEGAQGTLTQQEIWQIVDYVHSLPYEPASQPQRPPMQNTGAISTGE